MADVDVPDRFEVVREIGTGGMATVYLARDAVTQARVALKVLHPHLRRDELIAERFRREIAAARRVDHPNVASIHDLIETESTLLLVVEYHDGIDLKRLLRRREKLPVAESLRVVEQVLQALAAAHERGVVHRDVKPHNVLVDDDLSVKLTDFGLARVDNLVGLTAHTMSLGTPEYMAPELFGSHYVDSRADVYAVGVTLFEMLTGTLPFRASTPLELLDMHRNQVPSNVRDLEPEVPDHVATAIERALRKAPEDRFATSAEMLSALRNQSTAPLARDRGEPCRACGAPLPPGLGICVECGAAPVRIRQNQREGFRVFIPRPRNALTLRSDYFDNLTFEQKGAVKSELESLGAELKLTAGKLDQRLRHTPVILAHHLDAESAEQLAVSLEDAGVPVRVADDGASGRITIFRQFGIREEHLKTAIVGLGLLVPATIVMAINLKLRSLGMSTMVLPALITAIAIVWTHILALRPIAEFAGKDGAFRAPSRLTDRARVAFEEVRTPRVRQLLRRILQRGLSLSERAADQDAPDELQRSVDELLLVATRAATRIGALERENELIEPGIILERMRALQEKIDASTDIDAVDDWIEEKARQHELLATFDANYEEITGLTERLLQVSSDLSQHLAQLDTLGADDVDLMSMSQVILDLSADVDAFLEVAEVAAVGQEHAD